MSAWSDENAIKAFEYGFSIPAHKLQLGQEFELIRFKYLILIVNTVKFILLVVLVHQIHIQHLNRPR